MRCASPAGSRQSAFVRATICRDIREQAAEVSSRFGRVQWKGPNDAQRMTCCAMCGNYAAAVGGSTLDQFPPQERKRSSLDLGDAAAGGNGLCTPVADAGMVNTTLGRRGTPASGIVRGTQAARPGFTRARSRTHSMPIAAHRLVRRQADLQRHTLRLRRETAAWQPAMADQRIRRSGCCASTVRPPCWQRTPGGWRAFWPATPTAARAAP